MSSRPTLKPEEARYFQDVARRIAAMLLLGPELDANYEAIRDNAMAWPPKQTRGLPLGLAGAALTPAPLSRLRRERGVACDLVSGRPW